MLKIKVAYYTSGITGSGRIVRGIAIGNTFKRKKIEVDYYILHASDFGFLLDKFQSQSVKIGPENIDRFSKENYPSSLSYQALISLKPDILIVDLLWFPLFHFIEELPCKKIFLCRQVSDSFFTIPLENEPKIFNKDHYDAIIAIEPFSSKLSFTHHINPIVIRNRDEILSREQALDILNTNGVKKNCLIYINGNPGDLDKVLNNHSYFENEGYNIIPSTNYDRGLFPVVDYFNACDLIVCGAGYNSYWESRFFGNETIVIPTYAQFESGERRINECADYYFRENGADQLVDIIMNL